MAHSFASTSTHRSKIRRFGPRGRDATDHENSLLYPSQTTLPLPPSLSNTVQTSLLHVGMRVRKSVQDGYRNRNGVKEENYSQLALAHPYQSTMNELAPFCGSGKSSRTAAGRNEDDVDMLDFPSSSQESNSSSTTNSSSFSTSSSVAGITNKRSLDDDDDEDDDIDGSGPPQQSAVPLYPIFRNAVGTRHQQQRLPLAPTRQGRTLAVPRTKMKKAGSGLLPEQRSLEFEVQVGRIRAPVHDQEDFDEVEFLMDRDDL